MNNRRKPVASYNASGKMANVLARHFRRRSSESSAGLDCQHQSRDEKEERRRRVLPWAIALAVTGRISAPQQPRARHASQRREGMRQVVAADAPNY